MLLNKFKKTAKILNTLYPSEMVFATINGEEIKGENIKLEILDSFEYFKDIYSSTWKKIFSANALESVLQNKALELDFYNNKELSNQYFEYMENYKYDELNLYREMFEEKVIKMIKLSVKECLNILEISENCMIKHLENTSVRVYYIEETCKTLNKGNLNELLVFNDKFGKNKDSFNVSHVMILKSYTSVDSRKDELIDSINQSVKNQNKAMAKIHMELMKNKSLIEGKDEKEIIKILGYVTDDVINSMPKVLFKHKILDMEFTQGEIIESGAAANSSIFTGKSVPGLSDEHIEGIKNLKPGEVYNKIIDTGINKFIVVKIDRGSLNYKTIKENSKTAFILKLYATGVADIKYKINLRNKEYFDDLL